MESRKAQGRHAGGALAGRRLGMALATAGLFGLSLTSVAVSPASADPSVESFQIQDSHTTYCLTSGGRTDATAVEYSCSSSHNQLWYWGGEKANTLYNQLINVGTGQCLSVKDNSLNAGALVVVWSCVGTSDDAEYWDSQQLSPQGDTFYIFNYNSGDALAVQCDCVRENAPIDQENFNQSPNENWYIGHF
jgi:hypothetical protein